MIPVKSGSTLKRRPRPKKRKFTNPGASYAKRLERYRPGLVPFVLEGLGRSETPVEELFPFDEGRIVREKLEIRHARKRHMKQELVFVRRMLNESFAQLGYYTEIDEDEFAYQVDGLGFLIDERIALYLFRAGEPVAFLMGGQVDGCLHVEQLSVDMGSARRGLGRMLLEHAARRAAADGLPALTLTTFEHVAWNAPYYARLGFRILDDAEVTPGLRAIRRREAEIGLDRWPRVCMRRDVPG